MDRGMTQFGLCKGRGWVGGAGARTWGWGGPCGGTAIGSAFPFHV